VVARNSVAYFHDGIGISTYGTPDPQQKAVAIDIYNNDYHMMGDDFIETYGGVHNIRVMNNRGVNTAYGGLSSQPVFGGPVYFIRNVLYHVASGVAFKFSAKPAGLFVYHNTVISEKGGDQFNWLSPRAAGERLYEPQSSDWKAFASLADLRAATGQESHGLDVDYDVFESLQGPDGTKRHAVLSRNRPELSPQTGVEGSGRRRAAADSQ